MRAHPSCLEARSISLTRGTGPVLSNIDLALHSGEVLVLVGPNGAGKSSLLGCLSGLLEPTEGTPWISGKNVSQLTPHDLARERAFLEQSASAGPFPLDELMHLAMVPGLTRDQIEVTGHQALAAMDLTALARNRLDHLSGGQQHRAQMARVLAQLESGRLQGGGRWLLLDEPTASLDPLHQASVLRAARQAAGRGSGVLVVCHDLSLAAAIGDRIAIMEDGCITALGPPQTVLQPELLSSVYGIPMQVFTTGTGSLAVIPDYTQPQTQGVDPCLSQ